MAKSGNHHPLTWGANAIATALLGGAQVVSSLNRVVALFLAIGAGLAFVATIFLEYKQFPEKGHRTILILGGIVGLILAAAESYAFLDYKPTSSGPAQIVQPQQSPSTPAPATTVSATAEGNNNNAMAGGANNSITSSSASNPAVTKVKPKKGQE
jgi:hypothetical protein